MASSSKYYCDKLLSPKSLLEMTISAKGRRKATSRQNRLLWDPENGVTLKQFVHSISVVLATMVAKSVMVVMLKTAMTYLAICQFTETGRMHLVELPPIPFVLLLLWISVFTASICIDFDFSYFSAISFGFMGVLLTLKLLQ